jgi:hypothetical protein
MKVILALTAGEPVHIGHGDCLRFDRTTQDGRAVLTLGKIEEIETVNSVNGAVRPPGAYPGNPTPGSSQA